MTIALDENIAIINPNLVANGVVLTYAKANATSPTAIIAFIKINGSGSIYVEPASITYGGRAMSFIGAYEVLAYNHDKISIYALLNPPAGIQSTAITMPASGGSFNVVGFIQSWTGNISSVAGSGAVRDYRNPTITMTPAATSATSVFCWNSSGNQPPSFFGSGVETGRIGDIAYFAYQLPGDTGLYAWSIFDPMYGDLPIQAAWAGAEIIETYTPPVRNKWPFKYGH